MSEALFWLILNLLSIVVLAFYSMSEMAVVSLSKVRLQYYVAENNKKAERLTWLLKNSSRLFGTTLIGVNTAMVFGSEFARQFYESLHINPDYAPLTQVIIVILFGELAPMFAARRYSEHTAMLGANILYASAIVMKPFLWIIERITHSVHALFGGKSESFDLYLNQDEIRKILEEHHEDKPTSGSIDELNSTVSNIFALRRKKAHKIMRPIATVQKIPSKAPIRKMRQLLLSSSQDFLLVTHKTDDQIVGVAFPRDLLRIPDNKRIGDHVEPPWQIPYNMEVVHILQEFQSNNKSVAVVLSKKGHPVGVITLQDVLNEIFGRGTSSLNGEARISSAPLIERTFPGSMLVKEFQELYGFPLGEDGEETLSELMTRLIGHHPEVGDSLSIPPFDLEVKESTLLDVKLISIKTALL